MRAHAPLLSAFPFQQVEPPLQPSDVNPPPPPLTQLLAFPLQQYVPHLWPLSVCAPPLPLSVSIQGLDKTPRLPSTVRAYVPLLSALLLWQGVPLRQPLAEPDPLPQLSALPRQQGVPPLQPLSVHATPPLSVSLQGLGIPPPPLPSAVRACAPLLW